MTTPESCEPTVVALAGAGQFGAIGGLAVDSGGDVYVLDSTHDRVQKFTADGGFITAWGSSGSRVGQFHLGAGGGPAEPPGGANSPDPMPSGQSEFLGS